TVHSPLFLLIFSLPLFQKYFKIPPLKNFQRPFPRLFSVFTPVFVALLLPRMVFCQPAPSTNSYSRPWMEYWSFSNTNTWQTELGYSPVSYTNLGVSCLGDGTSVVVDDSTNAAWLQYNVWESDGYANLTVDVGSAMLWFAPDWSSQSQGGTGPG